MSLRREKLRSAVTIISAQADMPSYVESCLIAEPTFVLYIDDIPWLLRSAHTTPGSSIFYFVELYELYLSIRMRVHEERNNVSLQ